MSSTPHLDAEYERELRSLRARLLFMADRTEDAARDAVRTLLSWDAGLARGVEEDRAAIHALEGTCDDLCVRLLVRRRPVAGDLRLVLATLKIVTELERVSELAVNIVRRSASLADPAVPREIEDLARAATAEFATALQALRIDDPRRARMLQVRDSASNARHRAAVARLHALARERPHAFEDVLALTSVCRYLERIGDHAVDIARRVIYATEGVTLPHLDERDVA